MLVGLIIIILFALTGLFNGENSLSSIFLGFEIGVVVTIYCNFVVKDRLKEHVTKLMDGLYLNRYKQLSVLFLTIFLAVMLIDVIIYFIVQGTYNLTERQYRYLALKCNLNKIINALGFADHNFCVTGYAFYFMGSYFGLLLDAKYLGGSHKRVNHTPALKSIGRLVLHLIILTPLFFLPLTLIPNDTTMIV